MDEAKEISFAEISESVLFYFSAPALAKASSGIFAKQAGITTGQLAEPMKNVNRISNSGLKKAIKLGKFGQLASTFSIILPFVFSIAPMRNLMTLAGTGKKEFTSVVGLKKQQKIKQKKEAERQAGKLLKVLGISALAGLGAAFGILAAAKNKNVYKKNRTCS